jgi:hypothetical protein
MIPRVRLTVEMRYGSKKAGHFRRINGGGWSK